MRNPVILRRIVIVWCIFVGYFCCDMVVIGMPHHEPGHHQESQEESSGHQHDDVQYYGSPSSAEISESMDTSVFTNNGTTAIDTNPEPKSTEETTSETEPTTATIIAGGEEVVNATKATTTTTEFLPNEISRPLLSSPEEEPEQQQEAEENVVEDAGGAPGTQVELEQYPLNSIAPTIGEATMLSSPPTSLPLLPPPPPPAAAPVIDPISFQKSDSPEVNDDVSVNGNGGVSPTSPESFFLENLPIIAPGASSPSIQLIPPPPTNPSKSPDIPREPDQGELPESPEPHSPHPFNLHDLPISLISLSGNSGGSTSDMATFSSLVSPSDNVPLDFTKFRYHVVTGQLFKIGSSGRGVCPENMRFFAVPGHPKNGACDCDYYQCSRPLIYSPDMHQCYWAWSQGPCNKDEWFVFDKDLRRRGICEKNPCPSSSSSLSSTSNDTTTSIPTSPYPSPATYSPEYYFQNPEDEACYKAGTQGYCGDADERLLIYPGEPIPKCRKFTVCFPLTVPQELQCVFGNKYFVESGQCH